MRQCVAAGDRVAHSDRMRQIDQIVGSKTSCQLCGSCQRLLGLSWAQCVSECAHCVCLMYLMDCMSTFTDSKLTLMLVLENIYIPAVLVIEKQLGLHLLIRFFS